MQRLPHTLMRLVGAGLAVLALAVPALAQVEQVPPAPVAPVEGEPVVLVTGTTLLVSLVAGVILAIAFQAILTNLAIAMGLNIVGPFAKHETEDERKERKRREHAEHEKKKAEEHERKEKGEHGPGLFSAWRKVNMAMGIYAIVTASIGLFLATWLGVGLSFIGEDAPVDPAVGVVLGLVIWGVTIMIMARFEWSAMSSVAGGLYHMAGAGLRNMVNMARGLFTSSAPEKLVDRASHRLEDVAREIGDELLGAKGGKSIDTSIREYLRLIKPETKSAEMMRTELEEVLDEMELHVISRDGKPLAESEEIVADLVRKGHAPHRARRLVNRARQALSILSSERSKEGKPMAAKIIDAAQRMTGKEEEQAQRDRERIEAYLRNTNREELNPDAIERELVDLFRHPGESSRSLYERMRNVDRGTFVALLEQRPDVSHEDAERMVNRAMEVVERIRSTAAKAAGTVTGTVRHAGEEGYEQAGGRLAEMSEGFKHRRDTVMAKVRDYLDRTGRDELNYDAIMHDLKAMFTHPGEGLSAWRERLSKLDRDTIKGLLAARRDLDEQDAEMIVNQIETARDAALVKLHEIEQEAVHRMRQAREYALEQADEARKTAANMAWWALGTGVISGVAAALGGLLGAGFFV